MRRIAKMARFYNAHIRSSPFAWSLSQLPGSNAVCNAAAKAHVALTEVLVAARADIDAKNVIGNSALDVARERSPATLEVLMRAR